MTVKQRNSTASIYDRIRVILENARVGAARSVNTTQVVAYWLIGREIVEEEQQGRRRASYGENLLATLSKKLCRDFGGGFSVPTLKYIRQFYLEYPRLLHGRSIGDAVRGQLIDLVSTARKKKGDAVRRQSWQPGLLHPNLSWTHYRTLLRVQQAGSRSFYEIEAIKAGWTARELERQINSLLYERLALSKDKRGLMRLASKGQQIQKAQDIFKDPVVIEFLGLPESPKLVESTLEQALIDNLQTFLLELGKGFAFVKRQERLTLDGDHFYVDLVFYHTVLKCYVLLEIKTGKLTHEALGQLLLYVNYYDRERLSPGDNPTLGLILCTDKNDAVVRYTLDPEQKKLFARRYQLHLPTEAQLTTEVRRELRYLTAAKKQRPLRLDEKGQWQE